MEFALQAALLGAVMGAVMLAAATIYGMALAAAPRAFAWWAAAFVLEAASEAIVLAGEGGASALNIQFSDIFHGAQAALLLIGALVFLGRRVSGGIGIVGLLGVVAWVLTAGWLRARFELLPLPIFGVGGLPLLLIAWAFFRNRVRGHTDGTKVVAAAFALGGLHQLAGPLFDAGTGAALWNLICDQLLSMVTAVALLVVALGHQRALTASEGQRAAEMHTRLVEALGSLQDGVAVYDSDDRLVTCNERYRDCLGPCAPMIKPGLAFPILLEAVARLGVIVAAIGREAEWVEEVMTEHRSCQLIPHERQMWDGRWLAVSVYPTADSGHLRILSDITARKQAETSLEQSVGWLRGIMDTVVDGIIAIDDAGTVLSFNAAAARIFGYAPDEAIGRNVGLLMPEVIAAAHGGYLQHFRSTGEAHMIGSGRELEGLRKNGEVFPLEIAVNEMRQGDFTTFIGVVRDITERKRVENALVESQQRFRDLAESASDWFWEIDAQHRFIYVSSKVRQVLGVGPSFFLGRSFDELGMSCESEADWRKQAHLMAAGEPFRGFVFQQRLLNGDLKYVEMAGRALVDAHGAPCGYRGTASDITPLKRHDRELAAQSSLRQAIIDHMGQGVVVFNSQEQLVAINSNARLLLGLSSSDVEADSTTLEGFLGLLAGRGELGAGNPGQLVALRLARARWEPSDQFEQVRSNGVVLEVRSSAMPGGGLILTFTDITGHKRVEDTLRVAKDAAERGNRAKATFLANISHELRTPLNAIIGFSELMRHEIFGPLQPQSYRTYVDDINESGMHLLDLINDILDMSKAEAGMTDLIDSEVDIRTLVGACLRMMRHRAGLSRIEFVEDFSSDLPLVRADERRLRQIVLNLISNAVKFTEARGRVMVSAFADGEGFTLKVADTGIGMNEEDLRRVMEPFVQADSRLSRKYEGTGLGLPLTKALVEAHGGRLILESQPGIGTTATVLLPPERVVRPVLGGSLCPAGQEMPAPPSA